MPENKTDYISRAEVGKRAGVSGPTIKTAVDRKLLDVDPGTDQIDFYSDKTQAYVKKMRNRKKKNYGSGRPPRSGKPKTLENKNSENSKNSNDALPETDKEFERLAAKRAQLEVKKLEVGVVSMELKNKNSRSELIDFKFLDNAFLSCLQTAINQFNSLPDAIVDDLIALALDEGVEARAKIVRRILERINRINLSVGKAWQNNIDRVEQELKVKIIREDDLAGGDS